MHRTTSVSATFCLALAFVALPVPARSQSAAAEQSSAEQTAPSAVAAGVSTAVVSSYVWRGFVLGDQVSFQPTMWVRVHDVTISSFVNTRRASAGGHALNEHDLTVEYEHPLGAATIAFGWVNYYFRDPTIGRHSNELYVRSSWEGIVAPSVLVSQDVQEGSGTYLNGAVSHEWPVGSSHLSFETSAAVGYNHHQWTDTSGFSDANVGVKTPVELPKWRMSVAPFVNYSRSLNADIGPSRVYGGVEVNVF